MVALARICAGDACWALLHGTPLCCAFSPILDGFGGTSKHFQVHPNRDKPHPNPGKITQTPAKGPPRQELHWPGAPNSRQTPEVWCAQRGSVGLTLAAVWRRLEVFGGVWPNLAKADPRAGLDYSARPKAASWGCSPKTCAPYEKVYLIATNSIRNHPLLN